LPALRVDLPARGSSKRARFPSKPNRICVDFLTGCCHYDVVAVGATREPVTVMGGVRITPDLAFPELSLDDAAMLILTGADT
jgi:hypothetical protein